jgi:uncharacterized protein DUF6228
MSSSFSIKSNASDRELVFLSPRSDHFIVQLRGTALQVSREVYAYTDARGLSDFFGELAACRRPWGETRIWESLEGEFALSAACSALGQVTFSIRIRDMLGGAEEWDVKARVVTELGALPTIAGHARLFFDVVASA